MRVIIVGKTEYGTKETIIDLSKVYTIIVENYPNNSTYTLQVKVFFGGNQQIIYLNDTTYAKEDILKFIELYKKGAEYVNK